MELSGSKRRKLEEEEVAAEFKAPTDVDNLNRSLSGGDNNKRQRHSPERSEGRRSPSPTKSPKEVKSGMYVVFHQD
jgi:hypothetical protein